MADHGRATKLTRTETVAIKHLTAIADSSDTHSRLISDEEINLRPNAMICVLLFIAFIILGIIACNTIDAIETATVGITWLLVLIGVLSGAAGAWMIYFNRNPGKGILIFLGYYIIVALIPALFITGFYMYYYGCYNTEDYLRAVKDDEEYWNQKYGEEKTVEQANEKAFDAIWIQGAANVTVGMVILATLIPFGLKIKALGSLRVLTNVLVIPLVLAACGVTVTSFMMMNLYNDKQLVEEVDNINVIVPALIGMIVIGLGIMLVLQVSASRKGPTICVLASMLFFAVLGAYYGNICINGAALYDPHMDVVNGEMTDSFICSDVLGRMCDDNLRLLGCVEKFQPVEDCPPKAQLVESWDGEGLMCLNTDCCQVVRNSVKSGFIFVGLQSYALLGMTLLVAVVAFATFPDFNKYEVREDACDMIVIVSICILGIVLLGFGIYFLVIYQGEPYPGDAQMSGKVIDAGYVDPYLLTPTIFWRSTKFSELSFEDSKTCDSCYTQLQVNVTADNAVLSLDSDSTSLQENSESFISFTTDSEDEATDLLSAVQYCEKCLQHEGSVTISVAAIEYDDEEFELEEPEDDEDVAEGDGEDRRLADGDGEEAEENDSEQEAASEEEEPAEDEEAAEEKESAEEEEPAEEEETAEEEAAEPVPSPGRPGPNYDAEQDEESSEESSAKVPGPRYETRQVMKASQNILTETIDLSSAAGIHQEISGLIKDDSGGLGGVQVAAVIPGCEKLLATKTNKSGEYTIKLPTKANFSPYYAELLISCEGYQTMGTRIQVGGIPMVVSKRLPPWEISPEGTSGSVEFNVFKASRNQKLKTDIELVNLEGESFTDLSDVPSGLYELELFHKGYFKNNMIVNVVGGKNTKYNTSLRRQNLEPSDIAVTLNWNAQLKDLDLHVVFRSNVTETCQVYFNHKQCGGAKLINFAINGGNTGTESIKLEAGPSHYLFYARAVGGADDPFPLMLSDAHLNLYSFAKESQILSIDMPVATPVADTWIAFCYSGLKGPAGIVPLRMARKGGAEEEMLKICESLYGELEFPGIDVEVEGNEIIYDFKGP